MKRAIGIGILTLGILAAGCSGPTPYEEHGEAIAQASQLDSRIDMDVYIRSYNGAYGLYTDRRTAPEDCEQVARTAKDHALAFAVKMMEGDWDSVSYYAARVGAAGAWINHNNCPQASN